jgi:hypothetical protein
MEIMKTMTLKEASNRNGKQKLMRTKGQWLQEENSAHSMHNMLSSIYFFHIV